MSDHIHLTCRKSINQSDSGLLHDNPSVDKTVCRTRISPPPPLGIKDKRIQLMCVGVGVGVEVGGVKERIFCSKWLKLEVCSKYITLQFYPALEDRKSGKGTLPEHQVTRASYSVPDSLW